MKQFLILLFATACLAGCVTKKPAAGEEQNMAIARSMFEAFNKHEWETMASYYADTASFLDPSLGIDYVKQSRQQTIAKYKDMQSWMPDIHDEIVELYASGDKVFIEFEATGTTPDGEKFRLPIASIFTIQDGKITKDATYYDWME